MDATQAPRRTPRPHVPREPRAGHVRKVPQLLTIVTSPSASMRRSADTTVLRATPYSVASFATEGSRSCDCHSPADPRAQRRLDALARQFRRAVGGIQP